MTPAPDILYTDHNPPAWIAARGAAALEGLRAHGLPHRRFEDWKYSDLRAVLADVATGQTGAAGEGAFGGLGLVRIALCDGIASGVTALPPLFDAVVLERDAPAPDWVHAHLGTLVHHDMAGAALALMRGGVAIRVPAGVAVDAPLLLDVVSATTHHTSVLLVLEAGASLTLVESHRHGAGVANMTLEILLGEGATLHHIRLADSAAAAIQIETVGVAQAGKSVYRGHYADLGAKLSRLELHLSLHGAGADCMLSGMQVLNQARHSDVTTRLLHAHGDATSAQMFKQVVASAARGIYQGRVTVAEGADGSDSRQSAKALLLAPTAEADLKPELIIFAEDVQCAHGAAVGDIDAEQLFYLRSRGIPEGEARALLMRGFVEDAMMMIDNEAVRVALWARIEAALNVLGDVL